MSVFSNMRMHPLWKVENVRSLTEEEKQFVRCAIVVKGDFGYLVEFFTKKGIKYIPISRNTKTTIGFVPNIDNIKFLRLEREGDQEAIYRVEF